MESIKEQSRALVFCFGQSGALSASARDSTPGTEGAYGAPVATLPGALGALRLSHRGASRVGRVEPSGPRAAAGARFALPGGAPGKADAGGAGGRHSGAHLPTEAQPAVPAELPPQLPVRRKRGGGDLRRRPFGELPDPARPSAGPMAICPPVPVAGCLGPRPPRRRCRCSGLEAEEAEQSLSLARTKTRSYGSTGSVRAPLGAGVIERHVEHRVCAAIRCRASRSSTESRWAGAGGRGRGRSGSGRGARGAGIEEQPAVSGGSASSRSPARAAGTATEGSPGGRIDVSDALPTLG